MVWIICERIKMLRGRPKGNGNGLIDEAERVSVISLRPLGVLLIVALLSFGCLGSGVTTSQSGLRFDNAVAPSAAYPGGAVTQEGHITIRVPEGTLQQRFDEIKSKLATQSAQTSDISYSEFSDRKQYTVTVKVPPSRFDSINEMLKGEGEVKDMAVQLQ